MNEFAERGSAGKSAEPRFLVIGRVLKPHGVRGEVRVEVHTDLPERYAWLDTVYIGQQQPRPVQVEGVRFHQSWVLLKLAGYDDREAARTLRSALIQIPEDQSIPLDEDEYFLYQVIDLDVYTEAGDHLGQIKEVLEYKANNVFVVHGSSGEILIPDIDDVVLEIDFETSRMRVHLLPGLLP